MADRAQRKSLSGIVVSDKMQKTVVVAVERLVTHPLYGRRIRETRRVKAHDDSGSLHVGDRVEIVETRPLSRDKHWRVASILTRAE